MYFSRNVLFTTLLIISILCSPLSALSIENDLGSWTNINLEVPISKKVISRFQVSPRLLDNITDFNQFITHGNIGYKFNEKFSAFQGYAWSTTYIPNFRREQRLYNDIFYETDFKKTKFQNRFRFEERFLQSIEGISLRGRYRFRVSHPLDKEKKWHLVGFDEIFFNCNSHHGGPQAGLDQNRIYIGLNRKINEHFNIDAGYQLQHQHREGKNNDNLNHFILFHLNFILPQFLGRE